MILMRKKKQKYLYTRPGSYNSAFVHNNLHEGQGIPTLLIDDLRSPKLSVNV